MRLLSALSSVIAVARAGGQPAHVLAEVAAGSVAISCVCVFWGVWWAWLTCIWIGSACQDDDMPHRVTALVRICGVPMHAAGIARTFTVFAGKGAVLGAGVVSAAMLTVGVTPGARS